MSSHDLDQEQKSITSNSNIINNNNNICNDKISIQNKSNPILSFLKFITIILLCSVVAIAYEMSIEVMTLRDSIDNCPSYSDKNTTWKPIPDTACYEVINKLFGRNFIIATFWTIIITAGFACVKTGALHAYITTDSDFEDFQHKSWGCFALLIVVYFMVLLIGAVAGEPELFLRATPAFIGIPMLIVNPLYFVKMYFVKTNYLNNGLKSILVIVGILYMMIVINLVVIASYIVWKPSEGNYYEALQRGKWLLSAGYFFAWLAAQIVVCELHYVYTSYRPVVFNSNDQDIGNGVINDNINTDQIQLEYSTTSVFVLVHGLGFIL